MSYKNRYVKVRKLHGIYYRDWVYNKGV